jgi:tetratricopeptide (TPR) repeat protein
MLSLSQRSARSWLILWSLWLLLCAALFPTGTWTIDDAVKEIAATTGQGLFGTPVKDGPIRAQLANPSDFAALDEPFAVRDDGGLRPGFSPYARVFFQLENLISKRMMLIRSAVIAIALGWLVWYWGFSWGFVLLPLTFYGLVPWEHLPAWLLSLPALYLVFARSSERKLYWLLAGAGLGFATALRIEHGILVFTSLIALLVKRRVSSAALLAAGCAVILAIAITISGLSDFILQSQLNRSAGPLGGMANYSVSRLIAVYDLFLACGPAIMISLAHGALLFLGLWILKGKQEGVWFLSASAALVLYLSGSLYYIWAHPVPPLGLLTQGSFATALPWAILLLLPGESKTGLRGYALLTLIAGLLLVPLSSGVHWGPRLLLFAVPLMVIALYESGRAQGRAFAAALIVTAIQSVSAGTLVWARYVETSEHIARTEQRVGSPVVCSTRAQCADFAPLWKQSEFFTASTPSELRSLLVQFYEQDLDSVWLHLDAFDSLYVITFPESKPVWPHKMTIVNAGSAYKTMWRLYQLAMNREASEWSPLLEEQAARYMQDGEFTRALWLQKRALALSPDRAEAESNLGLIQARLKRYGEAREAVERALLLNPTLEQAQELLRQIEIAEAESSK